MGGEVLLKERKASTGTGEAKAFENLESFLSIQFKSYRWFLEKGIAQVLEEFNPIGDPQRGAYELWFGTGPDDILIEPPKKTPLECRGQEQTYGCQLWVRVRLKNRRTQEIQEQKVFMGTIPMMTPWGTFIVNGTEKAVVNQIIRSPGAYVVKEKKREEASSATAALIPLRGAWLEFAVDTKGAVFVKIDRTRKVDIVTFLLAMGVTVGEIEEVLEEAEKLCGDVAAAAHVINGVRTLIRDKMGARKEICREDALRYIHSRMRPGDIPSLEQARYYFETTFLEQRRYDLGKVGRYKVNRQLGVCVPETYTALVGEDVLMLLRKLILVRGGVIPADDIDHLGNRRVRSVGELLQNQFRIGLAKMERVLRDRLTMATEDIDRPSSLISPRPLTATINEFFATGRLSQFLDQTNPLSELTHKRRISALGPGGLTRERAGYEVRDIHPTHFGRICPIESPEGPNAGLIASITCWARVNELGFIETPYRKVVNGKVTDEIVYLSADAEEGHIIAPPDTKINPDGTIAEEELIVRHNHKFEIRRREEVDLIGVSPVQIVSVSTSLIPFLEHDDANRALMGANMQRQAVPLVDPEPPLVCTGVEEKAARDSGHAVIAREGGIVKEVTSDLIVIETDSGHEDWYMLRKFERSNQGTVINQTPIVKPGDRVRAGQVIADSQSMKDGILALGKNVLVAFVPWEGYNYEDAIVISERLVKDDVFTSVHIEEYETSVMDTKYRPEELVTEIPNKNPHDFRHLDENGIVRIGAEVKAGEVLVGKATFEAEEDQTAEHRLLRAIWGEKGKEPKDVSLRVPPGEGGRVIDVKVFTRDEGYDLPPGVKQLIRVYVAQIRKITVGDKMAGRHGNKGVIAKILPVEDMPHLPDGTPVDIILNPLGVPSRMNVGQIYETHLGWAAKKLGKRYVVPPFDEGVYEEGSYGLIKRELEKAGIPGIDEKHKNDIRVKEKLPLAKLGQTVLIDGRTGEPFEKPVTVGYMYMLKLIHMVEDKIHARSVGPYALVTQQPLGGKAQFGGQRFGEMEVWALEAYGAAYTLQEMLTIKSDDVIGRRKAYDAIRKGENVPEPGLPESFRVLIKELQALALDVRLIKDGKEFSWDEWRKLKEEEE